MVKSFLWDFLGKFSNQIITFVVSILLTRILLPEQFGVLGMGMVLIAIAGVFLNLGFSVAIVQQKEITKQQLSTIFYINIVIGFLLFGVSFLSADVIARFYNQPLVKPVFQCLSFLFIINSINLIPSALLYREMRFKQIALNGIVSTVIAGSVAVYMAYNGYGVWSLVVQTLIAAVLTLIFNEFSVAFSPLLRFDLKSIAPLWKYGSRMFLSGLLDNVFTRLDIFLIGKIFSPSTLGYYGRAQALDSFVRQVSSASIGSVLFPYFSRNQDNLSAVRDQYKKYLHLILFVSVGLGSILYVVSLDLFVFLFKERWFYSGELFRIMALAVFVWPVSLLMCTLISALGNSSAYLRLELYKKAIVLPAYLFGFLLGLEGFIYTFIIVNYVAMLLNSLYVQKQIDVLISKQLLIFLPYLVSGIIAAASVILGAKYFMAHSSIFFRILICSSTVAMLYFLLLFFFNSKGLQMSIMFLMKLRKRYL